MNLFPALVASPISEDLYKCAITSLGLFIFFTELNRFASSRRASILVGISILGSNCAFSSAILAYTFSISCVKYDVHTRLKAADFEKTCFSLLLHLFPEWGRRFFAHSHFLVCGRAWLSPWVTRILQESVLPNQCPSPKPVRSPPLPLPKPLSAQGHSRTLCEDYP